MAWIGVAAMWRGAGDVRAAHAGEPTESGIGSER